MPTGEPQHESQRESHNVVPELIFIKWIASEKIIMQCQPEELSVNLHYLQNADFHIVRQQTSKTRHCSL